MNRYKKVRNLRIVPSVFTVIFLILLFADSFVAAVLPKEKISVNEKRVLEQKPELTYENVISGEFTEKYEKYWSDTFPARDTLAEYANKINSLRGKRGEDDIVIYNGTTDVSAETSSNSESEKIYNSYFYRNKTVEKLKQSELSLKLGETPKNKPDENNKTENEHGGAEVEPEEDGNFVNNVFVIGDKAFEIFGRNDEAGTKYAENINAWRKALPESVKVYNAVIPKYSAFGLPEKYKSKDGDQKAGIEHIYSELDEGIESVDVYSALQAHKDEYIYFRTDHHWTQRGAYYAYLAFAQKADIVPLAETDFIKRSVEGYLGSLYSQTKDARLAQNPDTVEIFEPSDEYTVTYYTKSLTSYNSRMIRKKATSPANSYGVFIDGDNPLTVIENSQDNTGRKLVVVKESFGNCFVPFTAAHFDTVYVVDQRYYKKLVEADMFPNLSEFIEENGVTDVLFINNIQAALGSRKNDIKELLNGY